jgi:hypothetical protein
LRVGKRLFARRPIPTCARTSSSGVAIVTGYRAAIAPDVQAARKVEGVRTSAASGGIVARSTKLITHSLMDAADAAIRPVGGS